MAEQDALVLGALLHDIGKFWQRSGIRRKHEHLGAEFLDLPVIRSKVETLIDLHDAQNIISEHHESGVYDVLVRIAQIADRLASGERRALGEGQTQTPWEEPLKSVFAQIYDQEERLSKVSYPTRKLALNRETIFPRENVSPDYDTLWQEFLDEAEQLPDRDFEIFFESLFHLLKKYTWCVPSAAYKDHADISLFDHSKVTAAIAWCLYALRDQLGSDLSLSRITTLSSMISLFFEGYVNTLCEEIDPDRLYVIYTGGDDSFIVGSWDAALDFVQKLQADFQNYTCDNPKVTLSAALTLEARKYPLYKAADRCGEWLDLAKAQTDDNRDLEKSSFTFLGQPIFWRDFEPIEQMKYVIVNLVSDGGRSLLQRLMSAYKLYEENKQHLSSQSLSRDKLDRLVQNDRWRWQLAYNLAREGERSKPQRKEDLRILQTMIFNDDFIEFLHIATRWSELATRKRGE